MNILLISGISPSIDNVHRGGFITRQVAAFQSYVSSYYLIGITFVDNKKKLGLYKITDCEIDIDGTLWHTHRIEYYFIGIVLKRLFPAFEKFVFLRIFKNIDISHYDFIHGHWIYKTGRLVSYLARKYDKPHVLTAHGSDIHTIPFQTKRSRHHVLTTLKEAEKVIFVSNELLTQARKLGFDGKNALVIYNGIDSRHFYRRELTVAEGFTGIKKCNFTIGFVGNLEFVKGADLLPDIFSELQDKYRELQFIIVGHGTYRNQIQNNLKRKNVNFHMTGAIENKNLPYYLSLMDFLVMPSRNEGFGIVALEAQACGVAVIGRAVGGLKEIIKDKNYLVDASDDRTLINGIKFKFSNLLKSRSTEINELVEIYSLDRCIMMQLNLYSDFISRGRRKK